MPLMSGVLLLKTGCAGGLRIHPWDEAVLTGAIELIVLINERQTFANMRSVLVEIHP